MKDRIKLNNVIQEAKKEGLTQNEIIQTYKKPYILDQLIAVSKHKTNDIKAYAVNSFQSWNQTYKNDFSKLGASQVSRLAEMLEIEEKDLTEIILNDIKRQQEI